MIRLRLLAGLLGCLAVLVSGLPAVALASATMPNAVPTQTTASEPCSHCPDCDGSPCQPAAAGCVMVCVATSPTLGVASFALPAIGAATIPWPARLVLLTGLPPPPDPFPTRI